MSQTKLNGTTDDFAGRYHRLIEMLAEMELELIVDMHENFVHDNKDEPAPGLHGFAANITESDAWRDQLVEEVENAIDRIINTRKNVVPVVRHVYYSNGAHCVEVDGRRGDKSSYESIAHHPYGYLAMTPYYGGNALKCDKAPITDDGQVFAVVPVPYVIVQTSTYDAEADANVSHEDISDRWSKGNRGYEAITPYVWEEFAEYKAMIAEHEKKWPSSKETANEEPQDTYQSSEGDWRIALALRHGTPLRFANHERRGYAGISAYRGDELHVGEFRCDTQRGVVFA